MILLHVSETAFGNCLQPDFPPSRLLSGWLSFIFALSQIFVNSTFSFLYHFQHFQLLSKLVVFIKRLTPGVSYYNIKLSSKFENLFYSIIINHFAWSIFETAKIKWMDICFWHLAGTSRITIFERKKIFAKYSTTAKISALFVIAKKCEILQCTWAGRIWKMKPYKVIWDESVTRHQTYGRMDVWSWSWY